MRLYLKYFSIHARSLMQHKVSFFLTIFGQFLGAFSALLGVYFMMERFSQVEGFSFSEVLLCFAAVLMAFSLAETFARGFDTFPGMIGNGEFDRIMVRPLGAIFQVLASRVELSRLGRLAQAALVFAYAIPASGVVWTGNRIFTLILMILGGMAMFSGLFLIYAALCFFSTQGLEFMNIFTDGGREFGKYPLSVYGEGVLRFFIYVVPLALVQYYPLLYLLGRSNHPIHMLSPLAGFVFLLPCYGVWRIGLARYTSTGS